MSSSTLQSLTEIDLPSLDEGELLKTLRRLLRAANSVQIVTPSISMELLPRANVEGLIRHYAKSISLRGADRYSYFLNVDLEDEAEEIRKIESLLADEDKQAQLLKRHTSDVELGSALNNLHRSQLKALCKRLGLDDDRLTAELLSALRSFEDISLLAETIRIEVADLFEPARTIEECFCLQDFEQFIWDVKSIDHSQFWISFYKELGITLQSDAKLPFLFSFDESLPLARAKEIASAILNGKAC